VVADSFQNNYTNLESLFPHSTVLWFFCINHIASFSSVSQYYFLR